MKEAAWEVKTLWTETVMPRDALCTAFTEQSKLVRDGQEEEAE